MKERAPKNNTAKEAYDSYVDGLHDSIRTAREQEEYIIEPENLPGAQAGEGTPKEWHDKLKQLIEDAEGKSDVGQPEGLKSDVADIENREAKQAEEIKEYLAKQSERLDAQENAVEASQTAFEPGRRDNSQDAIERFNENTLTSVNNNVSTYVENASGLHVEIYEPHIYSGAGGKELFVYGGSPEKQADVVAAYLKENPKEVVFGASSDGETRIKYLLDPSGKVDATFVQKESFWSRLFSGSSFMNPAGPEEFGKLIK